MTTCSIMQHRCSIMIQRSSYHSQLREPTKSFKSLTYMHLRQFHKVLGWLVRSLLYYYPDARQRQHSTGYETMTISESLKSEILDNDNCRCRACGFSDRLTLEIDHIKPRSLGGSDDLDNLQVLCSFCNNTKANVEIEPLAIREPLALEAGFGDQFDIFCDRMEFATSIDNARIEQINELTRKARSWQTEGKRNLTIRKRLDKLTTPGIVQEILETIR